MAMKKYISYEKWKDEDTGDEKIKRTIHVQKGTQKQIKHAVGSLLRNQSPTGQIKALQKQAISLPEDFPERKKALWWLSGAKNTENDNVRMRSIAQAVAELNHAKYRSEKVKIKKARSKGGREATKTKRIEINDRNIRIKNAAAKMIKEGVKKSEIQQSLAELFELSSRQIGRILKKRTDTF